MKKEFLNYRYYVLLALSAIAVLFVCGQENENQSIIRFLSDVLADKSFGLLAGYCFWRLFKFWDGRNKIPFLSKLMNDEY